MTRWRTRALLGASAAALLIAFVPFGSGAVHKFGVLKRIAEERAALVKAEGLSIELAAARPCRAGLGSLGGRFVGISGSARNRRCVDCEPRDSHAAGTARGRA